MARLRGVGLGSGMALGTAAIIRKQSGVPLMPEPPARLSDPALRRAAEKPEVILVADDYQTALTFAPSLSWATVTGIAVEQNAEGPVSSIPAVVGAAGLMQAAAEDILVLVDAALGVIFVDPDAMYLAQYTAEHTHFAPKHRIFLDELHQPAQTLNGRMLTVITEAGPESVPSALNSGADAIYHELPLTFDSEVLQSHLTQITSVAAGKHLIFPYNTFLPLRPIAEAAVRADITLVVTADPGVEIDASPVAALTTELARIQTECLETDTLCGMPRVGADILLPEESLDTDADYETLSRGVRALAEQGATRLVYSGALATPAQFAALEALCTAAGANLLPVYYFGNSALEPSGATESDHSPEQKQHTGTDLRLLLGTGVSGTLVANNDVAAVKAAIRQLSDAECQTFLADWLTRTD